MEGAILGAAASIDANVLNGSPGADDEYVDVEDERPEYDHEDDDAPPIWETMNDEF